VIARNRALLFVDVKNDEVITWERAVRAASVGGCLAVGRGPPAGTFCYQAYHGLTSLTGLLQAARMKDEQACYGIFCILQDV